MTNVTLSVRGANVAKRWSITLWAAQIALAGLFGLAGTMKLSMAPTELFMVGLNYAVDIPYALLLFIGVSEVAGALGVIIPALTRIMPFLTPLAALGLATIQVLALGFHYRRGELAEMAPMNLALLALSLFVAWGRASKAPIPAR